MIHYLLSALILPPGCFLLLLFIGIIIFYRFRRMSFSIFIIVFFLFYFMSIPIVATTLAKTLSPKPLTINQKDLSHAQAIVVLGGGRYVNAVEYQHQDVLSENTLGRLQYAAYLYQHKSLPVLLTGGDKYGNRKSEAQLMEKALKEYFNVPVKWLETKSKNTYQNAEYTAAILKPLHIKTILLVTTAIHCKRAQWSFERFGFRVIPAPTRFIAFSELPSKWLFFVPSASAFSGTFYCLHEYCGLFFYWLKTHV